MSNQINDSANGNSSEPKKRGRPPGSKNKATLLAGRLAAEKGNELLNKAVEVALAGNIPMLKFLLERILPRERTVEFDLFPLEKAHDSIDAVSDIVQALAEGQITPREAADLGQVVSTYVRAVETTEAEEVFDDLKTRLTGEKEFLESIKKTNERKR
jgi:hypothetical protein